MIEAATVVLELYVRGQSALSGEAVQLVRRVCETRLADRFRLDVIDILTCPERVRGAGVVAVPTLIRTAPAPGRRTAGRLTEQRILDVLGAA